MNDISNKNRLYVSSTCFKQNLFRDDYVIPQEICGIELSGGNKFYNDQVIHKVLDRLVYKEGRSVRIHNYFPVPAKSFIINFATLNEDILTQSLTVAEKAMDLCRLYTVPYYSFHTGYLCDGHEEPDGHFSFPHDSFVPYESARERFLTNIHYLNQVATEKGVRLAIENLFVAPNNIRASLNCSFEELDEILLQIPEEIGLVLDLGHLNISAYYLKFDRHPYLEGALEKYGDRIFEVHISCNNGVYDQHLPVEPNDWQLDVLKKIKNCPGLDGAGICVTLESRQLDEKKILAALELVKKYL